MKVYRGSGAAARAYLDAGRARADDYYLAEGAGLADRYLVSSAGGVRLVGDLSGEAYEAWVQGVDPATGVAKGRLRADAKAVRFVEVVVNGPKSWSLAAELHPDIAAAYEAAQNRAAEQILGWLGEHATTRVGPRGAQVQVPVQELEAAVVRHYTSRAGDPHRHLHVQINARVVAEGKWRGLHTVGVRESLDAINGIGHAAVMTDPHFRIMLALHGLSLGIDGEIEQLREFVGPFSARTAQVARNRDHYEAGWRAEHPGEEPGQALLRGWDAAAWALDRPDKIIPASPEVLHGRWLAELAALGYRPTNVPVSLGAVLAGGLDRDALADTVLSRLAVRRSAWNAADIRGEVEQQLAATGLMADPAVRIEVAEDITSRTVAACVPLVPGPGVPEHIRALTSKRVLQVEADLGARIAARTNPDRQTGTVAAPEVAGLDAGQRQAVTVLAGDAALVVVEGAAGVGKTTVLAVTRDALAEQGRGLVVVTPTLKAAQIAGEQLGTLGSSVARLIHQHGYRWTEDGRWSRLRPGDTDPTTGAEYRGPGAEFRLRAGDLLLVDEAGMLDQDTALALFTVADEHGARVALVGDRRQLPAIGRGGVLDIAARWTPPQAHLTLDTVHRFADPDYAHLTLAMRAGTDPGRVFDDLAAHHHVRLHTTERERTAALAAEAAQAIATGKDIALAADTRAQVADLNAAVQRELITLGRVEHQHAVTTGAGERLGVGDRVATRRNDPTLGVANRETWTVTGVHPEGSLCVTGRNGNRELPASYVHNSVELAYATTIHGVQGDTAQTAHLIVGDHTTAQAAYVGMTRGRETNTVHLVASTPHEAREHWIAVFDRTRSDLGPAAATHAAQAEAANYAPHRALDEVCGDLWDAWDRQAACHAIINREQQLRDRVTAAVQVSRERDRVLQPLSVAWLTAQRQADAARYHLHHLDTTIAHTTEHITADLEDAWQQQREAARLAGETVLAGPGVFGHRNRKVDQAAAYLVGWANTWQPTIGALPDTLDRLARLATGTDHSDRLHDALAAHAQRLAAHAHPERGDAEKAVTRADAAQERAQTVYEQAAQPYTAGLGRYASSRVLRRAIQDVRDLQPRVAAAHTGLEQVRADLATLAKEPAIRAAAPGLLEVEHQRWATSGARAAEAAVRSLMPRREHGASVSHHVPAPAPSRGISL